MSERQCECEARMAGECMCGAWTGALDTREKLDCPNCGTEAIVTGDDLDLIDRALGCLTSDYNDVDHEAIAELRKRLRSEKGAK